MRMGCVGENYLVAKTCEVAMGLFGSRAELATAGPAIFCLKTYFANFLTNFL